MEFEEVSWWEIDVGPRGWGDELGFCHLHLKEVLLSALDRLYAT